MISEAIQTNIDAIKSLQDGELKVEGLEDSTLAMAEDTQKALMSCILDAETCRGILDSLPMIPEPQSRHLEEYMTNIQDKCQEKGRELDEWKVKLEAEKKKRTRHEEESKEKSVGMLRQQIRRWLRVKELAGVSLESEFEDTATYFGFVES